MKQAEYLLHPELIHKIPAGGWLTSKLLIKYVNDSLKDDNAKDPNISIVIRTLNEAERLEHLLDDIKKQHYLGKIDVIIVDNESTDRTLQVAEHYGAKVVKLSRAEFTFPKSMNLGVKAAMYDIVLMTVGHARLSNIYSLHAGARHFKREAVAGVFATTLPNDNATYVERLSAIGCVAWISKPAHTVNKASMGVLGATSAMISKKVWLKLGKFDERYETGGEDTALAKSMLENGYELIKEPALCVHHSHGLGFIDFIKQVRAWNDTLKSPKKLNKKELYERRPDLIKRY